MDTDSAAFARIEAKLDALLTLNDRLAELVAILSPKDKKPGELDAATMLKQLLQQGSELLGNTRDLAHSVKQMVGLMPQAIADAVVPLVRPTWLPSHLDPKKR